ncbi:MAG: hypothetical protein ACK2T4_06900 [Candidatus Promineifilaceae bacterium]
MKEVQIACAFFAHAYRIGVENLPDGLSAAAYTRQQLDRLGIGQDLTEISWGTKRPKLPPSTLASLVVKVKENNRRKTTEHRSVLTITLTTLSLVLD